ncbi:hypothetical protein [Natrinema halophilum]|uniref:Uncharacterized protein n=1 Tax=Natrinema halophilum TaxID=1699371 RepID=A0A7D5GFI7_9EURY|nr:hypothetical protein [Natrinema halophilum]QLG47628.1 hypothetical protein HYG82_01595 [Natrinema halophilum]
MKTNDRERSEREATTNRATDDVPDRHTICEVSDDVSDRHTICEVSDDGRSLGDCEIAYCPEDATHLVVLDTGRSERRGERYCPSHVGSAADDARADPGRDLVYGPVTFE